MSWFGECYHRELGCCLGLGERFVGGSTFSPKPELYFACCRQHRDAELFFSGSPLEGLEVGDVVHSSADCFP